MLAKVGRYGLVIFAAVLLCAVALIFYVDWRNSHPRLTFAMLDVGQGDAIFIESPTGTQLLIDAGPPRKILSALSRVMSPFDRTLDGIIITNPDQDHIGGALDVMRVYQVGKFFEPGTINDSKTYQNIKEELNEKKIPVILLRAGMRLYLGGGVVVEILFPDRDVAYWDTNAGSVVARLVYGGTKIMLTGDSTAETEKIILNKYSKDKLESSILKVGHHGSRTSTSEAFTKAVSPAYALISTGKDNKYGHPHREVMEVLTDFGARILRTDLLGTIVFSCDTIKTCEIN